MGAKSGQSQFAAIQLSIVWRTLTRHELGHLKVVALSSRLKASHNTIAIRCLTVLAHFPLAFEPCERKGKPMIPRNITSMKDAGASDGAHGLTSFVSC